MLKATQLTLLNVIFFSKKFRKKKHKMKKKTNRKNLINVKKVLVSNIIFSVFPGISFIWDLLVKFCSIWSPFQWITSLLTLILMYWMSGYYYNKFLSKKGGWMYTKTRIYMIMVDLLLNFSLGIYYMNYRDTFIGTLMVKCPVFCSPIFWCIELIFFYIYCRYISAKK